MPQNMPKNMPQTQETASAVALLGQLPTLPMPELWSLWDEYFNQRPKHRNRHYVEARLAYRIQEQAYGALSVNVRKMLVEAGAKQSRIESRYNQNPQTVLLPGTTLIREWEAREYRVTVTAEGLYEHNGQLFKSLSAAARYITGSQWNGPKFFGLRNNLSDNKVGKR
jgi:Protein of unknown function (DUF2924).